MSEPKLEHVNITASDPKATARMLRELFSWNVRWEGEAKAGGYTIHVGGVDNYIAIYSPKVQTAPKNNNYAMTGGLNHVGVVVDDLDETEERVIALGFKTVNHGDYEPGRRFYFHDADDIEWEVISYS